MASRDLGYWVIQDRNLLDMLRRVANGEDPDMVYAEEYANAEHEHHDGKEIDDGPLRTAQG